MFHTLLGQMALDVVWTSTLEGTTVRQSLCDDFISAMQSATDLDLTQFSRWYSQSGTPVISVAHSTDVGDDGTLKHSFTLSQHTPVTSDQKEKLPLYIPINIEIIDDEGNSYTDNESLIKNGMVILKDDAMRFTVEAKLLA